MVAVGVAADTAVAGERAFEQGVIQGFVRFPAGEGWRVVAEAAVAVAGEDLQLRRIRGAVEIPRDQHVRIGAEAVPDKAQLFVLVKRAEAEVDVGNDKFAVVAGDRRRQHVRGCARAAAHSALRAVVAC